MIRYFRCAFPGVGFFAVLLGLLPMAGCSSSDGIPSELATVWLLQEFRLDNGTVVAVDDPNRYTLDLGSDGSAAIRSDCNSCSGSYTVDGSDMNFPPMACTIAECGTASFDDEFRNALGTTSSFEIDGPLFLNYEGGEMFFTPQPTLF